MLSHNPTLIVQIITAKVIKEKDLEESFLLPRKITTVIPPRTTAVSHVTIEYALISIRLVLKT